MRIRGCPACRGIAAVALAAATAAAAAGLIAAETPAHGGPSVLLPYLAGASPYSGIGRYEGRATCTAFFLDTGPIPGQGFDAPAYALTAGFCPVLAGSNDVAIGGAGIGRVVFNFFVDSEHRQLPVSVARIAYATSKGRNIAVLELAASYRELAAQLIRPWIVAPSTPVMIGDPITIVGVPLWPELGESFLRAASCRTDGEAAIVLEHVWHWFDAPFNQCRDILPGSSGSPVISGTTRAVIAIVNTTTIGAEPLTECARGHPCEPFAGGARARPNTTYATSVVGIDACFDDLRHFDLTQPGCPLDAATEPGATPAYIGPVNPVLATQPRGPVRRSWGVTVSTRQPTYRFAIVTPPLDDCRTTQAYSNAISASAMPVIDAPLPVGEAIAFLCIVGTAREGAHGADVRTHPTVVVARTDLMPPRVPARVTITDTDEVWRVRFRTLGEEVAFYAFKAGPPAETRCADAAGYGLALDTLIQLPREVQRYRLCAIPYDAAQNPGALFERTLP